MYEIAQTDERVVATDRARCRLVWARRADHRTDDRDRVRPLEHERDDRRGADDLHKIVVEELALVDFVMLLGHRALDLQQAERGDPQAALLEAREDLARDAALDGIRLEDHERALDVRLGHEAISMSTTSAPGTFTFWMAARGPTAAIYASSGRMYWRATRCTSAALIESMMSVTSWTDFTRPRNSSCP